MAELIDPAAERKLIGVEVVHDLSPPEIYLKPTVVIPKNNRSAGDLEDVGGDGMRARNR